MNASPCRILMVNPWIVDVAAYDLWARPLGLLALAGVLRQRGAQVGLVDCLDRYAAGAGSAAGRDDGRGRGQYRAAAIPAPLDVPAQFRRYGMTLDAFDEAACRFGRPEVIFITTRMTYWYPGARLAIERLRRLFPGVPVALGGTYATLCGDHARRAAMPDFIVPGEGENAALELLAALFPGRIDPAPIDPARLDDLPAPAWDLTPQSRFPAILTSRGCPMACSYCASARLYAGYRGRSPESVLDEMGRLRRDYSATDLAFYDDALLVDRHRRLVPILEALARGGAPFRLHTPNGLHAQFIDAEMARLMKAAGMETVRLGLETTDAGRLRQMGRPAEEGVFSSAMAALRGAGFSWRQIGVYLLAALPGQAESEVRRSIDCVIAEGGTPLVGEYSPIPGTPEFDRARDESGLALEDEPLLHNNSLFHRLAPWSRDEMVYELRRYARRRLAESGPSDGAVTPSPGNPR